MKETIASNLIHYRKGLRLSQEQLAERVGITRQNIKNYEKAQTLPDSKTLSALAKTLGVTLDDLLRSESQALPNFHFRPQASLHKYRKITAQVLHLLEIYNALEKAVGIPPYTPENIPCYQLENNEKHIQTIAARFRSSLGLGEAPIANLFQAVEAIGLKVLRQPISSQDFLGISSYSEVQGAFIVVNTNITIEQQLFTLAREIGHLICHRDEYQDIWVEQETQEREKIADYFASHLLVYQVELEQGSSLNSLIELPPQLQPEDFPANERYQKLIWQALNLEQISELKAAELLNLTVEELRVRLQEVEVYAI